MRWGSEVLSNSYETGFLKLRLFIINAFNRTVYRICRLSVYLFFRIYYGLRVTGRENLPKEGGYILAVNHRSFIDPFLIASPSPHFVFFLARDTLWKSRIYRFGMFLFDNSIPLKRGMPDKTALKSAMERLGNGGVTLLFPEGTRTKDGNLGEIKKGPAFISTKINAPIVPAIMKGAYEVWPKGKLLPRIFGWPFRKLRVHYGEPLRPEEFTEGNTRDQIDKMTESLSKRMHAIFDEMD